MCDITKIFGAGSGILGGIGALFGAAGKSYEGEASGKAHELAASLARSNTALLDKEAQVAEGGVDLATIRGNYDEFLTRRKGGQVLAAQTSHFAGNNVDASYGSPLAIEGYSAAQIETDAQLIRARTMVERSDALTQVANIRGAETQSAYKVASEDTAANVSRVSGKIGALSSLVGAGAQFLSAGSKWPGLGGTPSPGASPASASPGFTPDNVGSYSSRFLAGGNPWGQ